MRFDLRTAFVVVGLVATLVLCELPLRATAADGPTKQVYVTSATAKLKSASQMSASDVATVKRGDGLQVLSEAGSFYEVDFNGTKGFVSKLFVSPNKPIGQNDLLKEKSVTDEKMSRKRAGSYSVSAATRGLSATDRNHGREQFRSNKQALEKVEAQTLKDAEIEKFQKDAKIGSGQ